MPMTLPVGSVGQAPEPYQEFCLSEPEACDLSGDPVMVWSNDLFDVLSTVNRGVNTENEYVSDWDQSGLMDVWDFPHNCKADCEDFALAKRRQLILDGLPSAALTMATAVHETELFPHAVLLAETTAGTWLLDNLHDEVLCWDAAPYLYLRRERPDGLWTRFQLP